MPSQRAAKLALVVLLLAQLACNTLLPPRPPIAWDPSPTALIVEAITGGGMLYEPNAMPDARLWGDGRLVWVAYAGSGAREVFTVTLTPDEMTEVLAGFVDAGFFGWDDYYSPGVVYDAPSTCLRVTLSSESQSVCETLSGAPAAFGRLYRDLAAGAGQASRGSAFVPAQGYLNLTDLGSAAPGGVSVEWPAADLGLALADVAATPGQWIEGEALAFAWGATNANPLYPILHDGDHYYQVQLLVPGVTAMQPPAEP
jgi:hypothetical protein